MPHPFPNYVGVQAEHRIAIVIVNYKLGAMVVAALEKLLESPCPDDVHIYVVDNHSGGHDAEFLAQAIVSKEWTTCITLVAAPENKGFGAGNNLVFCGPSKPGQLAQYYYLLNPDALVQMDAVIALADMMDERPHVAALGSAIRDEEGAPSPSKFNYPTPYREFRSALGIGYEKVGDRRSFIAPPASEDGPHIPPTSQADWVSGASVMLRGLALDQVGGFDERFFLYFEELDWMQRAHKIGWLINHTTRYEVMHHSGQATGMSFGGNRPMWPDYYYTSWGWFYRANHGRWRGFTALITVLAGCFLNLCHRGLRGQPVSAPKNFLRGYGWVGLRALFSKDPERRVPRFGNETEISTIGRARAPISNSDRVPL